MNKKGFVIAFSGPSADDGAVDVRELAPALLSLGRIIDAANLSLNGEKYPVKLEAKALKDGSFEVHLDVIMPYWNALRSLLDDGDTQTAKNLLEWIGILCMPSGSLIALYRFLSGRRPSKIAKAKEGKFILEVDGKTIEVPLEVMRLYQDFTVNKAFNEFMSVMDNDRINKITFRGDDGSVKDPSLTLTTADKDIFKIDEPKPTTVVDETRKMALSIRSLTFQEGNKWRLFDGQNTITATIDDNDFVARVDLNLERFAKGDVLVCDVRTVQTQGRDGLRTEHTVMRVLEHKPAPTQATLIFE